MAKSKHDLILHPVRLRVMTEMVGKALTTQQLAAALPDIPQASLYRHVKLLVDGGIFQVVAENIVNGAVERTYAIAPEQDRFAPGELSADDHKKAFNLFIASLSERFARYIEGADLSHLAEDGLSYNNTVIYLSDEERDTLQAAFSDAIRPFISLGPAPERRRYTLASLVIPDERHRS